MQHRHFILNKPYGYLCQFVCELKKKKLIGELYDFPTGTMAIGRLDEESEGLILLTTDGRMSEFIRQKTEKEYYAQVDGQLDDQALLKLQSGVEIGIRDVKYQTKPCKVFNLPNDPAFAERIRKIRDDRHGPTSWISITLSEGKYRQIRKMTAAVGTPTLRLVRVRVGNTHLNNLKPGSVEEVDGFEIEK